MTVTPSITPTPAQAAAATRLRVASQAHRTATRPIDTKTTFAALTAMTELLAAMDGQPAMATAYFTAARDAIDAAGGTAGRPLVQYTTPGGGNAATAWDAAVDARIATDLALLAARLDPVAIRAQAADLATATLGELTDLAWEAAQEQTSTSLVRQAYGKNLAAAVALARADRATVTA